MKTIKLTPKQEAKVLSNILADKQLMKSINKGKYYSPESFIQNALRYLNAINEGRMINTILSVSSSGMSRVIKFVEIEPNKYTGKFQVLNFYSLFDMLGYRKTKNDGFSISGCGMDMIFNTNYNIIRTLHNLEFIDKKTSDLLCQSTPKTI